MSDARIKSIGFIEETFSTAVNISIEVMLEELQPVVMEKEDFVCRALSIPRAHFGYFGLSRF